MKQKNEKRLRLVKVTIQDLETSLERDEQKTIKGGNNNPKLTTIVPVFCQPILVI